MACPGSGGGGKGRGRSLAADLGELLQGLGGQAAEGDGRLHLAQQHGRDVVGVHGDVEEAPMARRQASPLACRLAGATWWASSTTIQWGRPVRARSSSRRGSSDSK